MPRLILNHANKPFKIVPSERAVWICQCGLSQNKPFCDGSHIRTRNEEIDCTYYYSQLTQKQLNVSGLNQQIIQTNRTATDKVIFCQDGLSIIRLGNQSALFPQVVQIREAMSSKAAIEHCDSWSDLYLLKKNQQYMATMRVTQARNGLVDCESFYPLFLQDTAIRKYIASASRLYKLTNAAVSHYDILKFIIESWKDQYADGMRIDLINATTQMVIYYQRLGYKKVGSTFIHPRTLKESQAMLYIAHSMWPAKLSDYLRAEFDERESRIDFDFQIAFNLISSTSEITKQL